MSRTHLPPIEQDSFTYAPIRVAVRLVAIDARRHPDHYAESKPLGILNLAERSRMLWPLLYSPLVFVAKAVAQGYALKEVRWLNVEPQPRALHKRRPY